MHQAWQHQFAGMTCTYIHTSRGKQLWINLAACSCCEVEALRSSACWCCTRVASTSCKQCLTSATSRSSRDSPTCVAHSVQRVKAVRLNNGCELVGVQYGRPKWQVL